MLKNGKHPNIHLQRAFEIDKEETKNKISEAHRGKKLSEEHKRSIIESHKKELLIL